RLAEWEEEAAGFDGEGTEQDDVHDEQRDASGGDASNEMYSERGLVRVRMLKTAHMPSRDAVTGKMLMFALASSVVLVNEATVPALLADGLAEKIRE
ncbi:DNA breaking-rejoining protein, partial [Escherichia coli]|nr:DNA breaking-rejoining protein [Escherichia coli]